MRASLAFASGFAASVRRYGRASRGDLLHPGLDPGQIALLERDRRPEVVIEPVVGRGTETEIGAGEEIEHGHGEQVRRAVTEHVERFRVLLRQDAELPAPDERSGRLHDLAVERTRDGRLREPRADRPRNVRRRGPRRYLSEGSVGKNEVEHRGGHGRGSSEG